MYIPKKMTLKRGKLAALSRDTGYSVETVRKAIRFPEDLDSHALIRKKAIELGYVKRY